MKPYLKLIRPEQYLKNVFVLAPLFFGGAFHDRNLLGLVLLSAVAFCWAASSIYIVNDIFDVAQDRAHPIKSKRPLAAGEIKLANAFQIEKTVSCRRN